MNHDFSTMMLLPVLAQEGAAASAPAARPVGRPGASPTTATAQPAGSGGAAPQAQSSGSSMLPLIILVAFGIMFIPMILSGRKEQKKRKELMESMRKGDKVQTSGGIIGTVVELGQDDVVLRVEEGRIRFAKAAVVAVLKSSGAKPDASIAEPKAESKAVGV